VWGNELLDSEETFHFENLESQWTFEFSKGNCRGQNPMDGEIFYIIGKLLKHRCPKWACMTHSDIWKSNYGQKKGQESNWQFDSQPLKVWNQPNFLMCKWRATYHWKFLDKGYNFALDFISIRGLLTKLWGLKVTEIPSLGISRLPFGSPGTKCHLDVGLMERHKIYYKGKVVVPQVRAVVSLVSPSLLMAHLGIKSV
jgi:hypothetical protein